MLARGKEADIAMIGKDEFRDEECLSDQPGRIWRPKIRLSRWWQAPLRLVGVMALLLQCLAVPLQPAIAAAFPPGVWLMGEQVAIQVFDCSGALCGRVVFLQVPLDLQGLLKRDTLNPNPALRQRQVCGPTIIWNLRSLDSTHWGGGWFYNPEDGKTYRISMELKSADVIVPRIYLGMPIFGETRTLVRVPQGTSEGWC